MVPQSLPVSSSSAIPKVMELFRKEATWQILDQMVVSAGNFFTSLALARTFTPELYGTFSILYLALFAINTCHASLVVYPLTISAAVADTVAVGSLTGESVTRTLLLVPIESLALWGTAAFVHRLDLLPLLIASMIAWQLQETARRALLAHKRAMASLLPDSISYVGQGLCIFALRPHSLNAVFGYVIVTSCMGGAVQFWLLKTNLRTALHRDHFANSWHLGRYTLAANVLNMATLQLPSWTVNIMAGRDAVAGFAALQNPIAIANPIIFSVSNMLIPAIARSSQHGQAAARSTMFRYGTGFGALLLPCFAFLLVAPRFSMTLVYGHSSPYLFLSPLMRPLALALIFQYVSTVIGAYEGGNGRPHTYMWVQIAGTAALATGGILLIRAFGIKGAVLAMLGASIIRTIVFFCLSIYHDHKHVNDFALEET